MAPPVSSSVLSLSAIQSQTPLKARPSKRKPPPLHGLILRQWRGINKITEEGLTQDHSNNVPEFSFADRQIIQIAPQLNSNDDFLEQFISDLENQEKNKDTLLKSLIAIDILIRKKDSQLNIYAENCFNKLLDKEFLVKLLDKAIENKDAYSVDVLLKYINKTQQGTIVDLVNRSNPKKELIEKRLASIREMVKPSLDHNKDLQDIHISILTEILKLYKDKLPANVALRRLTKIFDPIIKKSFQDKNIDDMTRIGNIVGLITREVYQTPRPDLDDKRIKRLILIE